jgi:two-component system, NarL family, invasion response regulator UvrY
MTTNIRIGLVDDHTLFRKGIISLIEMAIAGTIILFEADNGIELKKRLDPENLPDIVLMDINMPQMNGFECVKWINDNYPSVKILVLSMVDKEDTVVHMLRIGVRGYLSKDVEPKELRDAIEAIHNKGYYYTDFITGRLIHQLQGKSSQDDAQPTLNDREIEFLRLVCTDMTYNDIAKKMFLSPKTVDGYRANLFDRLQVKSRVGLALYAIKNGIVTLN